MKKNYRKPLMKLHDVKVQALMQSGSVDTTPTDDWGNAKERNTGDWEEF